VPVRSDSPPVGPSAQSARDRRAISVVGHLLTTGIWLEHRLRNTPTPRTGLDGRSGWVRSPLGRLRSVEVQFSQPTRTQPSGTADVADISR
jgi:hypothetical protein